LIPPEPVSNTTAGIVLAASTISLTGSIFGVQYEALMWGMVGGLISLMYLEPKNPEAVKTPLRVFGVVAASSIFGGVFGPVASGLAVSQWPGLAALEPALRVGSPLSIGLLGHGAAPLIISFVNRLFGKGETQ